jgi:hypothetical protein
LGIISLGSYIKAKLKIQIDLRCRIVAGIFSYDGAKEVEAQEIIGEVAYGKVNILTKIEVEQITKAKAIKRLGGNVEII